MRKILILFLLVLNISFAIAEEKQINNLTDYFEYLPQAVHNNWTPHKANKDYEITVQFKIYKDGHISHPEVINSTNVNANVSAISAVKNGAPYKPLPENYKRDSVGAQVELKYMK